MFLGFFLNHMMTFIVTEPWTMWLLPVTHWLLVSVWVVFHFTRKLHVLTNCRVSCPAQQKRNVWKAAE